MTLHSTIDPSRTPAARAEAVDRVYPGSAGSVRALDGVSVSFPAGSLTAIMGPSGAGKSTLLHCLAGLDTVTSGKVFIGETELGGLSDQELTLLRRARIGFVFQQFNLIPTLSARENITLPLALAGEPVDERWFDTIMETVRLADRLTHRPSQLSGGEQQRVAVARAVLSRPAIIFADEPTGNLDSRAATEILELLRRTVEDLGQTIALVTHDPRAAAYADTVLFIADGRVADQISSPTADSVLERMRTLGQG
ncbi:ABC transporter ATP-binding protein [Nocardia sp. XZ_19_385]|uniref:ABC transporter ATP-binding protein n=1 Tax=Nocardia sp. XZ_19_385 TaxID=2769488 RepID=UPI00188EE1F3|nr:ABC transporter ATP-binding protein [Nocardia sp. XZ_19_385]